MSRAQLIQHWQHELENCQQAILDDGPRFRWLYLSRARIYRCLLRLYGVECDPETDGARFTEGTRPAPIFEQTPVPLAVDLPLDGKPPKQAGAIRSVLKSVAAANEETPQGGLTRSSLLTSPFVVLRGHWPQSTSNYEQQLSLAGISFEVQRNGIDWKIFTAFRDQHLADELLKKLPQPQQSSVASRIVLQVVYWLNIVWKLIAPHSTIVAAAIALLALLSFFVDMPHWLAKLTDFPIFVFQHRGNFTSDVWIDIRLASILILPFALLREWKNKRLHLN